MYVALLDEARQETPGTKTRYVPVSPTPDDYRLSGWCTFSIAIQRMDFASTGNTLNFIAIGANLVLTALGMLQLPSKDAFDSWWTDSGFCISQQPDRLIDTEVLCSILLIGSALVAYQFAIWKQGILHDNPQLKAKITGGAFGNFAHGGGHLLLYVLGVAPPAMNFEWSLDGIGNAVMTLLFFTGVFRATLVSLSLRHAMIVAALAIAAQFCLNVPSRLVFTYSQAVIIVAGSIDQMLLKEKGLTYTIVAASYMPLLILSLIHI